MLANNSDIPNHKYARTHSIQSFLATSETRNLCGMEKIYRCLSPPSHTHTRSLARALTHSQSVQYSPQCRRSPFPQASSAPVWPACWRWPWLRPPRRAAAIPAPGVSSTFFPCGFQFQQSVRDSVPCCDSADVMAGLKRRLVHVDRIQPYQWQSAARAWQPPRQSRLSWPDLCQVRTLLHSPPPSSTLSYPTMPPPLLPRGY